MQESQPGRHTIVFGRLISPGVKFPSRWYVEGWILAFSQFGLEMSSTLSTIKGQISIWLFGWVLANRRRTFQTFKKGLAVAYSSLGVSGFHPRPHKPLPKKTSNVHLLHNNPGVGGHLLFEAVPFAQFPTLLLLQSPTAQHSIIVGLIGSVSRLTNLPDTEVQAVSDLVVQESHF